ncbi:MAG: hypothetical protein C4586_05935 [Anaerolineaceae bacterium]|nr:MAG: hypothetical protein C4586_05935 [Anaerolineaceae bacterium]
MEFLYKNYLQTSTQITVPSNDEIKEYVMLRDPTRQWFSESAANDSITASMTITFDETTAISRIGLAGMNLKGFRIFYNGSTANTFDLTNGGAAVGPGTTTAHFSNNSETAMVLTTAQVQCTSITIDMYSTQEANSEKALGYLLLSDVLLDFARIPASSGYKPRINSEEIVHRMSDGGTKINVKDRKRDTDIKLKYISETFRDQLKDLYDEDTDFVFVAFPTTTGFDEGMFPCVWEGDFDFYQMSDNNPSAGFEGTIRLRETPT